MECYYYVSALLNSVYIVMIINCMVFVDLCDCKLQRLEC